MNKRSWIKYGVVGLVAVGFLVIVGLAVTAGAGLEDREWFVEEMVIDGTSSSPAAGRLTATFENGTIAGSGGCNDYSGAYSTFTFFITIDSVFSTLSDCIGQTGTMSQEGSYLSLLSSANRFNVDGETLKLKGGSGVLLFRARQVGSP